jgi:GntR family transcriptional regulator
MFQIRATSGEPIYLQLMRQVKHAVATGALAPGERMPTVRDLAGTLLVNPNTVARAYRDLEREGVLETAPGRGSFVRESGAPRMGLRERRVRLKPFITQLLAEAHTLGMSMDELRQEIEREMMELRVEQEARG